MQRRKIISQPTASVRPLSPSGRFEVFLGEEGTIDVLDLMDLHDAEKIIRELNLYLRSLRTRRVVANELICYLRHVLLTTGVVGAGTLVSYRAQLSDRNDIVLNTKYQRFALSKKFVSHLIAANVINDQMLPKGFDSSKIKPNQKKSFAEIARQYIENDANFDFNEIKETANTFGIEVVEAKALCFSLQCIDTLHRESMKKIIEWESDWSYVESVVKNLSNNELDKLRTVKDFQKSFPIVERTIEEALGILYAKFGTELPSVKHWPKGVEDFFRSKGWLSSRVSKLFGGYSRSFEDRELLASSIENLSVEKIERYSALKSFYHTDKSRDPRSIDLAISVLYSKYGRLLPDSGTWPIGLVDYLKNRGWISSRVRSAFFPTTKTVTPFLVGLLSYIELSPNVDTVAQYAYLNSFMPSENSGKIITFFDKYRGSPLIRECNASDPIISACVRHVERMKKTLQQLGSLGASYLRLEKPPLWLHYTLSAGRINVEPRVPEASTVTGLVSGFINTSSKKFPVLAEIIGSTGENFRPTCALILSLGGESSTRIQSVLNHAFATTTHLYTQRIYTQSLLKTKAKNFQQYMIDSVVSNQAGLENDESKSKVDSLFDNADFGVDEWINCDAKRIWFQDIEIIAEWVAWEKAICDAREDLVFSNPKRWDAYWAPRLVKYQNILALTSSIDKKKARELAVNIVLPPLS